MHAYTALGLVIAACMAVLIVRGDDAAFRTTFALMLLATVIDATDGLLARAVRVREVLPGFDGRQLDYLTDFLTYVVLPLLLVWRRDSAGRLGRLSDRTADGRGLLVLSGGSQDP